MRVLALDTTTAEGSVAIVEDDRLVLERRGDSRRSHTERLPADLFDALAECGLVVRDIDVFAIASGPGSFTGLRTGIATIQGLAFVTGKRVVPVSALAALAEAASIGLVEGALVAAWMDARRQSVFSMLARVGPTPPCAPDHLVELDPAEVGEPSAIIARWESLHRLPHTLIGDGATMYGLVVGERARILPPPLLASFIGRMAAARAIAGDTVEGGSIQPLYVRRPDVEIARERLDRGDGR